MTEAQAIEAMQEAWVSSLSGWPSLHPDVPFVLDDEEFQAPATWARFSIVHTVSNQISMGGPGQRRFERRGRIAVQLFGEVNQGSAQLAGFADDVRTLLECKSIIVAPNDYVRTYAGTTTKPSGGTDGRWAMRLVTIPYWYTETR